MACMVVILARPPCVTLFGDALRHPSFTINTEAHYSQWLVGYYYRSVREERGARANGFGSH